MGGIFLNYRHSDQRVLIVAAMRNALAHHFGDDQVFMDRQMSSGTRYPTAIRDGLEHADVLVAVIHEGWLEECKGPGDWVYEEIRSAITQGKYLVQLVLPGAARLKVKELEQRFPEIRELAVRQALFLRDLDQDMATLAKHVEKSVSPTWVPPVVPRRRDLSRIKSWAAGVVAALPLIPLPLMAAGRITGEDANYVLAIPFLLSGILLLGLLAVGATLTLVRHHLHKLETKPLFLQPFWRRFQNPVLLLPAFIIMLYVGNGPNLPWPVLGGLTLAAFYALVHMLVRLRDEQIMADTGWPVATTATRLHTAALHEDVGRLRIRLEQRWSRPLSRTQRDQALWTLNRLADAVDRLTVNARRTRPA